MLKWTLTVAALAGAGVVVGGCASGPGEATGGSGATGVPATRAAAAEPVEVLELVRGDNAALSRGGVMLVKDAAALEATGLTTIEGLSPNWDEQDVVILALGEQTTGGFWADIRGIQLVGDTLYVQGVVNRPGDDAATTQAITHPFAAALIRETSATRAQGDYEEVVGESLPE